MKKIPAVSVIVPVYNIEKYVRKCIDSILAQTFTDFELIIVDDGSKDSSEAFCDEYAARDSRVKVIHKPNGGLTSARNAGLDKATGEWIAHIDGDDWVSQNYLAELMSKAGDDIDMVFCDFFFSDENGDYPYKTYNWDKQRIEGLSEYISTTWTCLCGSIARHSLYITNGFRSPDKISYCEDFHLITRLCSKARSVVKVNKPLYHYRQQNASIIHNLNKKTEKDEQWVYADTIEYFKGEGLYDELKKVMAWRSLKGSQEMVLDTATFDDFIAYNPDKAAYIWSCPFIGVKLKIIMWCLTHNLRPASAGIVKLRKLIGR